MHVFRIKKTALNALSFGLLLALASCSNTPDQQESTSNNDALSTKDAASASLTESNENKSIPIDSNDRGLAKPAEGTEASRGTDENGLSRFQFDEVALERGLDFTYHNGEEAEYFAILENLGGGVGLIDFDQDGWQDVLLAGGGELLKTKDTRGLPWGLFHNHQGTLQRVLPDPSWGMPQRYSLGLTISDFNNDGFDDLVLTGYGGIDLLLNQGDGTFTRCQCDEFESVKGIVTSVAAGDVNGDGAADLYVVTYVDWSFSNNPVCPAPDGVRRELCSPKEFLGTDDYLFLSDGKGSFTLADKAGLVPAGKGLGVLAVDIDRDRDLDLYVANDTTANFLYLNHGDGSFEEVGILHGAGLDERALPNGSMGLSTCDVDGDLQLDIWVANYERESFALYRNEGGANFFHMSRRYGISALGGMFVGFGTDWEDFDRDGIEEIVVTNGHVLKYPTGIPRKQKPLLLAWNQGRFETQKFSSASFFSGRYEGRGLAVGDLDNDGRQDIVISHINENAAYLANCTSPRGSFLRARLAGTTSSRNAVGATLVLKTTAGFQIRAVVGGGSYLSHNAKPVFWGIPDGEQATSLEIFWPSGKNQTIELQLDSNQNGQDLLIVEPF